MPVRQTLALAAAASLCAAATEAAVWPISHRVVPVAAQMAAPPIPDAVSPPAVPLNEGFVPPGVPPGPRDIPETDRDDDPIGRRYVDPPAVPAPPPGLEIVANPAGDAAGPPLSLEDALALAAANNPTLLQARAQVQGTLGMAVQAGLWPNPTLIYTAEKIGAGGTPGEFQGGQLRQEIVTADKRDISRAKYLQRSKSAEWVAVEQQWRVCNDVRVQYWRGLGRQQIVGIRRELLKTAEDNVVTARERWNLGQETRSGLHLHNVALQEARLNLLMAENDALQAYQELIALIGCDLPDRPLTGSLDGPVSPVAFDAALARYRGESPQMLRAVAHLRESQITLKRELVQPIPNIFIQGGPGYDFTANETVANASIMLDLPIFNYNQGTIREAESDLVRQKQELRRIELMLRQNLAAVYRNYLVALQHVEQYRDVILPETRAAYKEQLDAYKEDRQNWGDVLMVQRTYFDQRLVYVTHLIALRENETLIDGYLLTGGLSAPNRPTPPGHIDAVAQPR